MRGQHPSLSAVSDQPSGSAGCFVRACFRLQSAGDLSRVLPGKRVHPRNVLSFQRHLLLFCFAYEKSSLWPICPVSLASIAGPCGKVPKLYLQSLFPYDLILCMFETSCRLPGFFDYFCSALLFPKMREIGHRLGHRNAYFRSPDSAQYLTDSFSWHLIFLDHLLVIHQA